MQGGLNHNALAYETLQQAASVLRRHERVRAGQLLQIEGEAALQLSLLDRPGEAVERLYRILPGLAAFYGPESWEVVLHQAMLAGAYSDLDQHAEAAALVTQITPKLDHADAAHALNAVELRIQLGYAAWNARKRSAAEDLLGRAIADADRLLGPVNSLSVEAQRTLGLVFTSGGRFEESARTLRDSVDRAQTLGGEDFAPTRFAESFAVIALVMTGKIDEARAMAERSVKDAAKVEGLTPSTIRGFTRRLGLGLLYVDAVKATQVLEDVLAQEQRAGADKGGAHGTTLLYLAGAHARAGHHAAAAEAARQAALAFAEGPPNYAALAHSKLTEALARARLHQAAEAESLIGEARALLARIEEPNQTDPLFVELVEAERLRRAGQIAEAERIELPARERLRAIGGISQPPELALVL